MLINVVVLEQIDRSAIGGAAILNIKNAAGRQLGLDFEPALAYIDELETLARTAGVRRDLHPGAVRREAAIDFHDFRQRMLWNQLEISTADIHRLPFFPRFGIPVVYVNLRPVSRAAALYFHAFAGRDLRREAINGVGNDIIVTGANQLTIGHNFERLARAAPTQSRYRCAGAVKIFQLDGISLLRSQRDRSCIRCRQMNRPVVNDEESIHPKPHAIITNGRKRISL